MHVVYVCVYGTCGACIYVLDMCIWWCMYVYVVDVWLCMFLMVHVVYICVYHTCMVHVFTGHVYLVLYICLCILWMHGACCACIHVYVVHICNCKCKIVKFTQYILQTVTNIGLQFLANGLLKSTWKACTFHEKYLHFSWKAPVLFMKSTCAFVKSVLFMKNTCAFHEKHLKCAFHMKSTWKATKQLNSTHISHSDLVFHRVQREC